MTNKILLITTHIEKAFGVRYLSKNLIKHGFEPIICSIHKYPKSPNLPTPITEKEIKLLKEIIEKHDLLFIGISILSSYILSEVNKITKAIKEDYQTPVVWGRAYPSLMPQECAKFCDIVIKGEAETAIVELARVLQNGGDWQNINNLCYYDEQGNYKENELLPLIEDLDTIGYPLIGGKDIYHIENDRIIEGDPQTETDYYETNASRGCLFSCTYCSSSKIRGIYKGKGRYNRKRSVDNVIAEIKEALSKNKNIKEIRFWDEIFISDKKWLTEFADKYSKEIGLKYAIWWHPILVEEEIINLLYKSGLRRILLGIQSGSPNIRNNIFKRPETNKQILKASKILSKYKDLEVYYDLIICHVLETMEELKETFNLCLKMSPPFGLQIRGLSYLPQTDIIQTLIQRGIYTEEEMNNIFNSSFEEHFIQWNGSSADYYSDEPKKIVWADLIYLTQYPTIRKEVIKLSHNAFENYQKIKKLKNKMESMGYEERERAKFHPKINSNIIDKIKDFLIKQRQ